MGNADVTNNPLRLLGDMSAEAENPTESPITGVSIESPSGVEVVSLESPKGEQVSLESPQDQRRVSFDEQEVELREFASHRANFNWHFPLINYSSPSLIPLHPPLPPLLPPHSPPNFKYFALPPPNSRPNSLSVM